MIAFGKAVAQDTPPPTVWKVYDCLRAEASPVIDGNPADPCWSAAPWANIAGVVASARIRLLWDDVHLYFAAEITDPTPRVDYHERDSRVWEDDCIEIYLSPARDGRSYFELDFNAAGAIWDSFGIPHHTGRGQIIRNWTAPSLEVKTQPRDGGWTIEGRIRFDDLTGADHVPPQHDDRWPANFYYLDRPAGRNPQIEHAWNPTDEFKNLSRFGVLRFVDEAGQAQDRRDAALAAFVMSPPRLAAARPAITEGDATVVSSQSGAAYIRSGDGKGWSPKQGFGRLSSMKIDEGDPPSWRARPNDGDDPTLIDLTAPADGELVVLARLTNPKYLEEGQADGVWLRVGEATTLRVRDARWRAATLNVRQGDKIRIAVDAGPAGSYSSDSVQLSLLMVDPAVLDDRLPGWQAVGEKGLVRSDDGAIRVTATDHFVCARRDLPAVADAKLYRLTGRVRTELLGTTRAHVGIDYFDKDGVFIRQATTRAKLEDHLRWGLCNFGGKTDWTHFVAYSYDPHAKATTMSLWVGVNAWDAPDAAGDAWFDDVKVEAVEPDPKYPLGFPPLEWSSLAREQGPSGQYMLSRTPIEAYQLPNMPGNAAESLDAIAWPDSLVPASFSIHADGELRDVRVTVSNLQGEGAARIPASRIAVRKVCYIYRKRDLMMGDQYLLSPNHLEPFETLVVPAKQTQQCWLTVDVPADADAGSYQGTIRVTPAGENEKTLAFKLQVLPIRPRTRPGIALGLYSYYMPKETPDDLRAMLADMRAHGMTTTFQFNAALRIPIEPDAAGRLMIRWDQPNQLAELLDAYRDAGFTEPLMTIAPQPFQDAAEKAGANFDAVYTDLYKQVLQQAETRKWPALHVAPYDEGYPYPVADLRFERSRQCAPLLRSLGIPVAAHALNHPTTRAFRYEREFENATDIILQTTCHPPVTGGPAYRGYASWAQYRDAMRSAGKRVMFYNPDTTGVHPEAMRFIYGVGLWVSQADGVMDWHYCEHSKGQGYQLSKRQGAAVLDFHFPPAEGHAGGPTIGWEAAREGVKDYQLLYTLDQLIAEARKSGDGDRIRRADAAHAAVQPVIDRVRFDTIDPVSTLTMGRWNREMIGKDDVPLLIGEFKVHNGLSIEDYELLRKLVCDGILQLQEQ